MEIRERPAVQVLLSTYNGARFLEEQLDSLAAQDFEGWSLLIRDDGSRDETLAIIARWRARHPDRAVILPNPDRLNLGFLGSFSRLLEASTARYVMFADQDDVWLPGKISMTLAAMKQQEDEVGPDRPVLVHTDLTIVDARLRVVAPSSWRHQGLVPRCGQTFSGLLVENVVWGCTAMLNRALVDKVRTIPPGVRYHDWWIALVAAAFGDIVPLPRQTVLWRRHGANESESADLRALVWRALRGLPATRRRLAILLEEYRPRTRLFLERYGSEMPPTAVAAARALLLLPERGYVARRIDLIRHRLFFSSPVRIVGLLALI